MLVSIMLVGDCEKPRTSNVILYDKLGNKKGRCRTNSKEPQKELYLGI